MKVRVELSVELTVEATIDVDEAEVREWASIAAGEPILEGVLVNFLRSDRDYDDHLDDWYAESTAAARTGEPFLNLTRAQELA